METLAKMQAAIILEAAEMAGEIEALKEENKRLKLEVQRLELFAHVDDSERINQLERLCNDMYFQWEHENDNPQSYSGYLQRLLDDFHDRMADLGLLEEE